MRRLIPAVLVAAIVAVPVAAGASGAPAIPAVWVTGITSNSAVLRAEIDPEELSTRYHFEYLTLAAYEANLGAGDEGFAGAAKVPSADSNLGSGSDPIAVSFTLIAPLNPLLPDTTYVYRAVAANGFGVTAATAHTLRTRSPGAPPGLPDQRAWELVSPIDKGGGAIAGPRGLFGGGEIQAAAGGRGLTYGSATAFGEPASSPPVSQYISTRGAGGWSTADVSPPMESGGYGDHPDGAPFRLFSDDLGRGVVLDGRRCVAEGTCRPSYSLWSAGLLQGLATAAGLRFEGANADLSHIVLGAEGGLFEWSGGVVERISAVSGTALAAPLGAIAEDGSRVYFVEPEDGPIRLHDVSGTRLVPETTGGGAAFQAASADGALAYFLRGGELYRYSADAEASTPIASGVSGVLAVSPDGSRVYYQDASGLELWHEGAVRRIAAGEDATLPSDYPPATATVRLAAGGTVLAFLSAAPIGDYDNLDADTGSLDTEVYLYDATADSLRCASCNPTGERPTGSASIPGILVNGSTTAYRSRALSNDGRRLFFESADALVGNDTDSSVDVYEWEAPGEGTCTTAPGCVGLISGGRGEGGRFLDASADGADSFFLTGDSLVGADPGSIDAYDARVGGGLPEPEGPIPCDGDACQPLPSPPEDPAAGTSIQAGGNPPPHYMKEGRHRRSHHRRHKHRHHRKHHHRKGGR